MGYLYVGIGGFIGAILRVSFGNLMIYVFPITILPFSTLVINLLGVFILTYFLVNYAYKMSKKFKLFFSTGLLGSFTTFSAFSLETIALINSDEFILAFLYISLSLIGGVLFAYLGFKTVKIKSDNIVVSSDSRRDES